MSLQCSLLWGIVTVFMLQFRKHVLPNKIIELLETITVAKAQEHVNSRRHENESYQEEHEHSIEVIPEGGEENHLHVNHVYVNHSGEEYSNLLHTQDTGPSSSTSNMCTCTRVRKADRSKPSEGVYEMKELNRIDIDLNEEGPQNTGS